ncbi:MAG: DNA polymerase III subunit beta [Candidatus Moranbacteria bacterium CG23_combo_of_CG06-09_8_20_14_all_39_10]|nr:MAG: DNA polymerase III subunit beta [Candidatus Moranbacteria bacterium CG23_combo_of_CG06-09_8_20_14_all_39_10]
MKLICTQENFRKAIFNSERMASKQNTLPILNNILFEANKSGLRFSATNLEIGISVQIGAKIENEGRITIPAKLISNFVNNLPQGENIALEVDNQNLKIKSGSAKAIIKGLLAEDFPLLPKKNTEFLLNISSLALKNIISKVITCVAFNETRQELTGVNLILKDQEILFAATDSFRLIECKLKLSEKNINPGYNDFINKKSNLIIPANTLVELARIISADVDSEVKIALEDGQAFFEIDGTNIVSRLINGAYPEYKHIIPAEFKTRIVGEKNILQGAVKMASVFSSGKTSEVVLKTDADAKKFFIEARSVEAGENSSELNVDITGPSQEIVFNSKYLLDGINIITTTKAALLMNSNFSPVAIKEIDEKTGVVLDEYIYIVMPIKN